MRKRDRASRNIINKDVIIKPIDVIGRKPFHNYGYTPVSPHVNPKMLGKINVNIETWANIDKQTYYCWGDYWVQQKLKLALEGFDVNVGVEPKDADFTIYLWGSPYKQRLAWPFFLNPLPTNINICWHYSHPTKMTREEMEKYHVIFCLSEQRIETIKSWHPNVMPKALLSCTDFRIPEEEDLQNIDEIDILFIGNARGGLEYGRKAIQWLEPPLGAKVIIYGHKWHLPKYDWMKNWFAGQYWKYEELNIIYNKSRITLVDGHEDMGEFGFVPMKIFDILASGGFALSSKNIGIQNIFGDSVPQYRNKEEMNEMVRYFLEHEEERKILAYRGCQIATFHTYQNRALTFLKTYQDYKNLVNLEKTILRRR